MTRYLSFLQRIFFFGIMLTFPFNLFKVLTPNSGYVQGLQMDYLLLKLYVVDIFIWGLVVTWLGEVMTRSSLSNIQRYFQNIFRKTENIILAFLFFTIFLRQFFTPFPLIAIWQMLSWTGLILVGWWIYKYQSVITSRFFWLMSCSIIITQSILGLYQFTYQRSLFPYQTLGETQIQKRIGISKSDFYQFDQLQLLPTSLGERLLPYGTTAHPNILAGVISLLILFIWLNPKKIVTINIVVSIFGIFTVFLTQSVSAWLSVIIGVVILFQSQWIRKHLKIISLTSLMVFFFTPIIIYFSSQYFDTPSLYRRDWLNQVAIILIKNHPILGTGVQQFTAYIPNSLHSNDIAPFWQPVHHVGLLLFSEVGIVGIILILFAIFLLFEKNYKTVSINQIFTFKFLILNSSLLLTTYYLLPILVLDHYLFTIRTGQVILIVAISVLGILFSGEQMANDHDRHRRDLQNRGTQENI